MKTTTKALIYSGLVFPGAGYFILQRVPQGVAALLITLSCLVVMVFEAFHKAQIIAEKIVMGDIPFDITLIREQIIVVEGLLSPLTFTLINTVIIAIWLIGIMDCYRIGKRYPPSSK